jgi:phosphomannomutase
MALKFGTSGVRGLVTEMTDRACCLYTRAFLQHVKNRTGTRTVALAGDHRPSTPQVLRAAVFAAREEGFDVRYCGRVPTPTLTLYGMRRGLSSLMVTGSHVPADRNGIKFNMPWGEVLKRDEQEISAGFLRLKEAEDARARQGGSPFTPDGDFSRDVPLDPGPADPVAREEYIDRYLHFFPADCLEGLRVVFYQHSSVSRNILPEILVKLGAQVESVGWSDSFVPVDTEAVENPEPLANWVREFRAHALATTDGDADRPLLVNENGRVIRGDVLGILVASYLGADSVSAPVSCNTALEACGRFHRTRRTRIGSPYVIESMHAEVAAGNRAVVGYEANGGFLTATDIRSPDTHASLRALPTRDAALPILALLHLSMQQDRTLGELVSDLPGRYTESGLLRGVGSERGTELVNGYKEKGREAAEETFGKIFGDVETLDFTDGARILFRTGEIVHLRPSGNAPEFRCYTEAASEPRAKEINAIALRVVAEILKLS